MCPVPQLVNMASENDVLMKEYTKMMTDMILLCATLALSLFFWILSLTISAYSGEGRSNFLSTSVVRIRTHGVLMLTHNPSCSVTL